MKHNLILKELELLRKENNYLKHLLANIMHQREEKAATSNENLMVSSRSHPEEKIKLFKSLFKGRLDVFAYRWESEDGRKGYAPSCKLEWQKPICQKPIVKCSECSNRKFIPLSDQVLYQHLSGKKTVGIYPLLQDNTCFFLAIDFDKQKWQKDVLAFVNVCKSANLPVYIERSRSGEGAHVWFFFSESIPASLARKLGEQLLFQSMVYQNGDRNNSFDRMFPNQDNLPTGGFGNLIALPLQLHSKNQGNSVFVDANFNPYQDQWLYLSNIEKINKERVISLLNTKNHSEVQKPSPLSTLPDKVRVTLKNGLYLEKSSIPEAIFSKITSLASFGNPEYFKAQSKRLSTYGMQKVINCFEENIDSIILPRGCLEDLEILLKELSIEHEIIDNSFEGEKINVNFHGQLTTQQEDAIQSILPNRTGILAASTGFGKTVTAAAIIAKRQVNTLVIVDRTQLIQQWISSLSSFLQMDTKEIGQIGGGKKKITGKIDVATIQSLNSNGELKSFITQYGQVIVDECHHISAFSFEKVLKRVRPKFIHGLTATPIRRDGLQPIIFMQCGPIRYKTDAKTQSKIRPFLHTLIPRITKFHFDSNNIQEILQAISSDKARNRLLFDDVLKELENGRSPIILTERIEHLENLQKIFKGFAKNIIVLTGNMSKKEQKKEMERLLNIPIDEERLILATGKYIGEGFDDPRLDTLFLAMPVSWKGTLQQYVGRLHRIHSNKQEVKVYDYVDAKVPLLKGMYEKRFNGYKSMGYTSIENKKENPNEQMKLF
ncbi:DEAD/DEAH box helicase family protein [Neobacillus drentensis]|uniref:TOTE conflict system archaeo-eukaryotic primase domain-containing protein n=1 Tax=Neobacillus drentensis TaxID=220684 RepID=UPI002FFDD6FA